MQQLCLPHLLQNQDYKKVPLQIMLPIPTTMFIYPSFYTLTQQIQHAALQPLYLRA
jgi:hypothetical protein